MKKILISGGGGKLAGCIKDLGFSQYVIDNPSRTLMDIRLLDEVIQRIKEFQPDYFIHTAAYTRPMRKHQENPDMSIETNIIGTANVALACMRYGVKLVYISTDYVYPGTDGNYKETDPVSPYLGNNDGVTKYGWSKLGGEASVRIYDNSLILRLCMSNKPFPHPKAAVDIRKSYLYEEEAAKNILNLIDNYGTINVGGPPQTAYEFASATNQNIQKLKRSDIKDVKIAPDTTMDISKMESLLRDIEKNER
tara:strand:+ start:3036 stop:3788 length:753 start_codon:yes stop_codon:yes gene_type:complete